MNESSLPLRNLDFSPTDVLFVHDPKEDKPCTFKILSNKEQFLTDKIQSINIKEITEDKSKSITCNIEPAQKEKQNDQGQDICNLSYNKEDKSMSFSLEVEENSIYSITKLNYITNEKADASINFEDKKIPRFRANLPKLPQTNNIVLGKGKNESVSIDFVFQENSSHQLYQKFKELECTSISLTEKCQVSFEGEPTKVNDIQMLLDNIYYPIEEIEIITYEKVDNYFKNGIKIKSLFSLKGSSIDGTYNKNTITLDGKDITDETSTSNEEEGSENKDKIYTTLFKLSEYHHPNGIYETFTLTFNKEDKDDQKVILTFPKEVGNIIVNTVVQANIKIDSNQEDKKSIIYLLFAKPLFDIPEISSIDINIKSQTDDDDGEEKNPEIIIEKDKCSISDSHYSLICESTSSIPNDSILYNIITDDSYLINVNDDLKFQNLDESIIIENSFKIIDNNEGNIQFIVNFNQPVTSIPMMKLVKYLSDKSDDIITIDNEKNKLSLNGKKMLVRLDKNKIKEGGIYQLIYGEEEISYQDICLFYQNEVDLGKEEMNLPIGNAKIEAVTINLKAPILDEQIRSIKFNKEYLNYELSDEHNTLEVYVPKDFTVSKSTNFKITIKDFHNNEHEFEIKITDYPPITLSQTFFVNNDQNKYSVFVSVDEDKKFQCKLKVITDLTNLKEIDLNEKTTPVGLEFSFSNYININFIVLDKYEYTFFESNVYDFKKLFKEIDTCFLSKDKHSFEPVLSEYYAINFSEKDFRTELKGINSDGNEQLIENPEELLEGTYRIYYYYQNDKQSFHFQNFDVHQPNIPDCTYIEGNSIKFEINNICDKTPEPEIMIKKGSDEIKCSPSNVKSLLYVCPSLDTSSDEPESTNPSFSQGEYDVLLNGQVYKKIIAYNQLNIDDLTITIDKHSGNNNVKISLKQKENSNNNLLPKDLTQIESITITYEDYISLPSAPKSINYSTNTDDENLKITVDKNNMITLPIKIEEGFIYTLTDIKLKNKNDKITVNSQLLSLPKYEKESKYIFFNSKSEEIYFNINIITYDNPLDDHINVYMKESADADITVECNTIPDKANKRIYQCKYQIKDINLDEISFKGNKEDTEYHNIPLIKYELNEDDKCLIKHKLTNGKIIKLKIYSEETLGKVTIDENKYYFGQKNEKTFEYNIDISQYEIGKHKIQIEREEKNYLMYKDGIEEEIVIKQDNSIVTITPSFYTLSDSNKDKITITFNNPIGEDITNLQLKLFKSNSSPVELTCEVNNKDLECSINDISQKDKKSKIGDYTRMEYIIDSCKEVYDIDFTLTEYKQIEYDFDVDFYVFGEDESKQYKVTITSSHSLDNIKKITFDSTSTKNIIFCKDGEKCETFNLDENMITLNLPFKEDEKYSLIQIMSEEDNEQSYKLYKPNSKIVKDYSLEKELILIEKNTDAKNIVIEFYQQEIAEKRQKTIKINEQENNNCVIKDKTKLECPYSYTAESGIPVSLSIKPSENDHIKTITILQFTQDKQNIPIGKENETVSITFSYNEETPLNVILYLDNSKLGTLTLSKEEDNVKSKNSFPISNDKFTTKKKYLVSIKLENTNNEEVFTSINAFNELKVESFSKDTFYKTDTDLNIIITFNDNIELNEIQNTQFLLNQNEDKIPCEQDTSIYVESNQISCTLNLNDETKQIPEGSYSLQYSQYLSTINSDKQITIISEKETSISPLVILKSSSTRTIEVSYSKDKLNELTEPFTVEFIDDKKETVITKESSCKGNKCSLTLPEEVGPGKYKIRTTPQEKDKQFKSVDTILIIENEIELKEESKSIKLTKGYNNKPIDLYLTKSVYKEQIEKVTLEWDENGNTIIYNLKNELINTNEDGNNDICNKISLHFDSIIIHNDKTYTLKIKSISKNAPLTIQVTKADNKYEIKSIVNKRIQIGNDLSFELNYNREFESNEKPIQIQLIEIDKDTSKTFIFNGEKLDVIDNKVICKLGNHILNQEGFYSIKTIFDSPFNDYYSTTTEGNDLFIASFLSPPPTFEFSRHYLKVNEKLEIKVGRSSEVIVSIDCKSNDSDGCVKDSNNANAFTLSKEGDYIFKYSIDKGYNFQINQKVRVKEDPIISIKEKIEQCQYYKRKLSFSLISTINDDEYMKRIKVILKKTNNDIINDSIITLEQNNEGIYTFSNEENLKGETNLQIIENDDDTQPLYSLEITFTDLSYPSYAYYNSTINFKADCVLSNLELSRGKEYNKKIIFNQENKSSIEMSNVKIGKYTLKVEGEYIDEIMIINLFKNSQFKLNIPSLKINEPITIQILSPNNEFNMNLIEKVLLKKNEEEKSVTALNVENNVLSFEITVEQGDIYSIDYIKKKQESHAEVDDDLIMKLDESTNKIITDRFKLDNIYFYGFEGQEIDVKLTSISNQLPKLTIQQKGTDNIPTNCEEMNCKIAIQSSSIYIVKDTPTQIEKEIYVSILDIDKDYPICQNVLFDNSSPTTVLKIKLISPIKLPYIPILKLDEEKCESLQDTNSNVIHYSLTIEKNSYLLKDSNTLTLETENKQITEFEGKYSFYLKNKLNSISGFLFENKKNQNIVISLERERENFNIYFIPSPEKQEVFLENCVMFESKTYECEINLENTIEGSYQLFYESECGEEIPFDESVSVLSESDLPFTFPESIYLLEEEEEGGYKDISIKIYSSESISDINVYYKEKDNPSAPYQMMNLEKKEDNITYSVTIKPTSSIEYQFAYSYMINGYKIPLSQTIKLITPNTKEITIEPELSSCYYYKEPISFKIIPLSVEAFKDIELKVTLKYSGSEDIALNKSEEKIYILPNDNREPGEYQIIIEENNTDEDKFYRVIDITLTTMSIEPLYYKSSIIFSGLTCVLNSFYIQKENEKVKLPCTVDEGNIESEKNLKCTFPETMKSFGEFLLYSGNNLITSSLQISNNIANSNFTLIKKQKIVKGINKFYLESEDFLLEYISTINIMVDGTGPFEYKKTESDYIFNYLDDSNRIEIIVDIKDITKEYVITEIIRKELYDGESEENLRKTVNLILTKAEIEECPTGQVINSLGYCDDPENIEDDTTDKCDNYCKNNKTCTIVDSLPKCECGEDYFGLQCEIESEQGVVNKTEKDIEEVIKGLNQSVDDSTTEEFVNTFDVYRVKSISILIIQKPEIVIRQIGEDNKKNFQNLSKKSIKSVIKASKKERKNPPKQSFALIHCAILIQINFIRYRRSNLRNLQEEINELNELVQLSHNLFASQKLNDNYIKETDITGTIIHQGWKNKTEGIEEYSKMSSNNKLTQISINQCEGLDSDSFAVQTNIIQDSNDNNLNGYINAINKNGAIIDLSSCKNIEFIAAPNEEINNELAEMYALKGIDIYNPLDPAFQDSCYISEEFDFDLTQKYRRKNIFQGKTFKMDDCSYDHADYANNTIHFKDCSIKNANTNTQCNPTEEICIINSMPLFEIMPYSLSLDGIDVDHVDNLPTKCPGDVKDIHKNIAFWIYLLIFILLIIFNIILCAVSKKQVFGSVNGQGLNNHAQTNNNHFRGVATSEANLNAEGEEEKKVAPSDVKVSIESKSCCDCFSDNFKALHPLFSLCNSSLFSPALFTSWVFVYNIFNLFGFNALYFNETMLEDRITDNYRDNFGYPMKTEFEKIMAAIATSIALNLIVRGITIVTYKQKEELESSFKEGEKKKKVINEFIKSMLVRRIIAGIFMLILSVFFFYYTIVFCGIYVNAQYGWFYSGIWSLLWVWVVFAPIYIGIISIVESAGNTHCAFYMKRLFIF